VVSDEERQAIEERMEANMMPLAEQMIERAQLANWDEDGDGFLSDAERAAGEANDRDSRTSTATASTATRRSWRPTSRC
jgi:hypothetical protein